MGDYSRQDSYFASQDDEVQKRYGGITPKKKPLISKDHQRAFFDSADWALYKQQGGGDEDSSIAMESLRPKLQRTPHQQLPPRRPTCSSGPETHAG